ncbi:hypothetical protein UlMin_039749 [Ulmus minor]
MVASSSFGFASNYSYGRPIYLFSLFLLVLASGSRSCCGLGTFGFDFHHRFSDPVKGILGFDGLPELGTVDYYSVMVHRDHLIRGRHLAADDQTTLAFYNSNETYQLGGALGYLHYANVSLGTPSSSYFVALDTGSDLFWLPCDCSSCVHGGLKSETGEVLVKFNIYSPNSSSTSKKVSCDNSLCQRRQQCPSESSDCPYQVVYLSNGTSSTGILVEDVLHLSTDDDQLKGVDAQITFGCGKVQTGSFLEGAAPDGLLGLGIKDVSVPSILAKQGLTSNSFSMCFGPDGLGRIKFGDNGSLDQGQTPFNLRQSHPTYNITVTQITVEGTTADLEFNAVFDSGTSFTYLNDPAYTQITESFNSQAKDKRHTNTTDIPFEYCYDLNIRPNQTSFTIQYPSINLTMKGGHQFNLTESILVASIGGGRLVYCLGVVKSDDINIIGQNFMTGYQIIFDREKLVLGWKPSNCFDDEQTTTLPINPSDSPAVSPTGNVTPEATAGSSNNSATSAGQPPRNHSPVLSPFTCALMLILLPFIANF